MFYARRVNMTRILMGSVLAVAALLLAFVFLNLSYKQKSGQIRVIGATDLPKAGNEISVTTWNLGYAGLGADSDFIADGGVNYLPPGKSTVLKNLDGIGGQLENLDSDVFIFQEIARNSPLNYWVDVFAGVKKRFHGWSRIFSPDVHAVMAPSFLRLDHGLGAFSRLAIVDAERRLLPLEDDRYAGIILRQYLMQVLRLPTKSGGKWTVINIHLAAFDKDGLVRRRQLREVLAFAQEEFGKGNAVIIGGDWNMEFVKDKFPHRSETKHRFWLQDFPLDVLPAGWTPSFDASTPSVRTLYQPYEEGVNYSTIIDAFVVSPNVETVEVKGYKLQFRFSDHQPVTARFRFRPLPPPA